MGKSRDWLCKGMLNAYEEMTLSIDQNLSKKIIDQIRTKLFADNVYGSRKINSKNINSITDEESGLAFPIFLNSEIETSQLNVDAKILQDRFDLKELPYKYIDSNFISVMGSQEVRLKYFNKIIEEYNSHEKTLENIITMVRDLERLHPYRDFNCRTFAVLILNRELIKADFVPCIMEDPNMFDYKSIKDLTKLVKEGQNNFASLYETGLVHEQDPTNQQWYNALSYQTLIEFHKCTKNFYRSLDELDLIDPLVLLKSLPNYRKQYEKTGIKIEHSAQLDNLIDIGFSLDLLQDINNKDSKEFEWLIKNSDSINLLMQSGTPKDNLIEIYKTLQSNKLLDCIEDISKFVSAGENFEGLIKTHSTTAEKMKFLLDNTENITYLAKQGLSIHKLLKIYDENLQDANILAKSDMQLFTNPGYCYSLSESKLKTLLIKDEDYKSVIWLVKNSSEIKLNRNTLIEIYEKNPEKAQHLINSEKKLLLKLQLINGLIETYQLNLQQCQFFNNKVLIYLFSVK